jgi:hypothetical protein
MSAADGALGGCDVSICLSNLDFCSKPWPHIAQVNCEEDEEVVGIPIITYSFNTILFRQVLQ